MAFFLEPAAGVFFLAAGGVALALGMVLFFFGCRGHSDILTEHTPRMATSDNLKLAAPGGIQAHVTVFSRPVLCPLSYCSTN